MTMHEALDKAMRRDSTDDAMAALREGGIAMANEDSMSQAIHDVYCGDRGRPPAPEREGSRAGAPADRGPRAPATGLRRASTGDAHEADRPDRGRRGRRGRPWRTRSSGEGSSSPRSSAFLAGAAARARGARRRGRGRHRQVDDLGGRRRGGAAADAGVTVLSCRPARSEQRLTLGGLTDLLADIDDEALGEPAGSAAARARDRAAARRRRRRRSPDQRTLSVAVAGLLRRLADGAPGPAGDRRRPVARRELRGDPRLRASGGWRTTARRSWSRSGRAPATPHRTARCSRPCRRIGRSASRVGPMPLASLHRLFQAPARAGRSRGSRSSGSRRRPVATRSTRWRSPARSREAGIQRRPARRRCRSPTRWPP